VINLLALIVGCILLILSIVHIWYGEKNQISSIEKVSKDSILVGSFRVMSVQGGVILFTLGLLHLLNFMGLLVLSGVALYFPLLIILINVVSLVVVALVKHRGLLRIMVPQLLIFSIIILLEFFLILG
jgi:hypothetical protein